MFEFSSRQAAGCLSALLILSLGCGPESGRTVAAADEDEEEEPEPVAVTVFTDTVELFMEYPRLVPGLAARYLAHVTVLETGAPVRSGRLVLELTPDSGDPVVLTAERPTRDGLFIPVGAPDSPGTYRARIVVESDQVNETIDLEPIVVHPDMAAAFAAAEADHAAEEEHADALPFLLEAQWKIGMLMEQVEVRSLTHRIEVLGEIEAPRNAMAVVSSSLAGRLLAPDSGRLPGIGERVEQGDIVAYLEPPLTTSDAAQFVANEANREALEMELMLREFDLRAKALEVEQALHQSRTRLEFGERSLARLEALRAQDLGTVAELEAARQDVELARRASAGAEALGESFARAQTQLDGLVAQRAAARAAASAEGRGGPLRIPLVAPISGQVVAAEHVAGEHVESHEGLYRVLDLSRVWVAIHIPEFDLGGIGAAPGALLEFAAFPGRTFDVVGDMEGSVVSIGRVVDPETRTVTLRYEATNPDGILRAGMYADVFLETQSVVDAVALPRASIVMDAGRPVAFVLIDGETFQKRFVELGIHDGPYVEARSGIEVGDRVVTHGAYLVRLAAAAPASFGDGHAH